MTTRFRKFAQTVAAASAGAGGFAVAFNWFAPRSNPSSESEPAPQRIATGVTGFGNEVAATLFESLLRPSMGPIRWMPSLYPSPSQGSTTVTAPGSGLYLGVLKRIFTSDLGTPSTFLPLFNRHIAENEQSYGGPGFIRHFARASRRAPVNTDLGSFEILDEPTEAGQELGEVIARVHTQGASQVKSGDKQAYSTGYVTGSSKQHGYIATITTYNPYLYKKLLKDDLRSDAKVFMTWFGGIPGIPGVLASLPKFSQLTSGTYDKRRGRDLPISSRVPGDEGSMRSYFSPPEELSHLTDFPRKVFELLGRDVVHCSPSIIRVATGTKATGMQRLVAVQMNTWPGYHSLAGVLVHGHYIDTNHPGYVTRVIAGRGYSEGISDARTQSFADCLNVPAGIALWFSAALMQDKMAEHRKELEKRFGCKVYNLADKMVIQRFPIRDMDGEILSYENLYMPWWYGAKDLLTRSGDSSLYNLNRAFYLIGKGGTPAMHQVQRDVIPALRDLFGNTDGSFMPDEDDNE